MISSVYCLLTYTSIGQEKMASAVPEGQCGNNSKRREGTKCPDQKRTHILKLLCTKEPCQYCRGKQGPHDGLNFHPTPPSPSGALLMRAAGTSFGKARGRRLFSTSSSGHGVSKNYICGEINSTTQAL